LAVRHYFLLNHFIFDIFFLCVLCGERKTKPRRFSNRVSPANTLAGFGRLLSGVFSEILSASGGLKS
jgi:hypothetical protein